MLFCGGRGRIKFEFMFFKIRRKREQNLRKFKRGIIKKTIISRISIFKLPKNWVFTLNGGLRNEAEGERLLE